MNVAPRCALHVETAALGTCERCGTFICGQCKAPVERRTPAGLARTIWMHARNPARFSRRLDPHGGVLAAMLYSVALLVVVQIFGLIRALAVEPSGFNSSQLAFIPLQLGAGALGLTISAAIIHVGCLLWRVHTAGFRGTLRVFAYASSPILLTPIFWFGSLSRFSPAIPALTLVLVGVGLAHTFAIRPLRVIAAIFVSPLLFAPCCFVALYNFFSASG